MHQRRTLVLSARGPTSFLRRSLSVTGLKRSLLLSLISWVLVDVALGAAPGASERQTRAEEEDNTSVIVRLPERPPRSPSPNLGDVRNDEGRLLRRLCSLSADLDPWKNYNSIRAATSSTFSRQYSSGDPPLSEEQRLLAEVERSLPDQWRLIDVRIDLGATTTVGRDQTHDLPGVEARKRTSSSSPSPPSRRYNQSHNEDGAVNGALGTSPTSDSDTVTPMPAGFTLLQFQHQPQHTSEGEYLQEHEQERQVLEQLPTATATPGVSGRSWWNNYRPSRTPTSNSSSRSTPASATYVSTPANSRMRRVGSNSLLLGGRGSGATAYNPGSAPSAAGEVSTEIQHVVQAAPTTTTTTFHLIYFYNMLTGERVVYRNPLLLIDAEREADHDQEEDGHEDRLQNYLLLQYSDSERATVSDGEILQALVRSLFSCRDEVVVGSRGDLGRGVQGRAAEDDLLEDLSTPDIDADTRTPISAFREAFEKKLARAARHTDRARKALRSAKFLDEIGNSLEDEHDYSSVEDELNLCHCSPTGRAGDREDEAVESGPASQEDEAQVEGAPLAADSVSARPRTTVEVPDEVDPASSCVCRDVDAEVQMLRLGLSEATRSRDLLHSLDEVIRQRLEDAEELWPRHHIDLRPSVPDETGVLTGLKLRALLERAEVHVELLEAFVKVADSGSEVWRRLLAAHVSPGQEWRWGEEEISTVLGVDMRASAWPKVAPDRVRALLKNQKERVRTRLLADQEEHVRARLRKITQNMMGSSLLQARVGGTLRNAIHVMASRTIDYARVLIRGLEQQLPAEAPTSTWLEEFGENTAAEEGSRVRLRRQFRDLARAHRLLGRARTVRARVLRRGKSIFDSNRMSGRERSLRPGNENLEAATRDARDAAKSFMQSQDLLSQSMQFEATEEIDFYGLALAVEGAAAAAEEGVEFESEQEQDAAGTRPDEGEGPRRGPQGSTDYVAREWWAVEREFFAAQKLNDSLIKQRRSVEREIEKLMLDVEIAESGKQTRVGALDRILELTLKLKSVGPMRTSRTRSSCEGDDEGGAGGVGEAGSSEEEDALLGGRGVGQDHGKQQADKLVDFSVEKQHMRIAVTELLKHRIRGRKPLGREEEGVDELLQAKMENNVEEYQTNAALLVEAAAAAVLAGK